MSLPMTRLLISIRIRIHTYGLDKPILLFIFLGYRLFFFTEVHFGNNGLESRVLLRD